MGIRDSICINEEIVGVSCKSGEPKLSQNVVYEASTKSFVNNITREVIYKLGEDIISNGTTVLVTIPGSDEKFAYRVNPNGSVTVVNYLFLEFKSEKYIFLVDESIESYIEILENIPKEFTIGLFIKVGDTYKPYSKLDSFNFLLENPSV